MKLEKLLEKIFLKKIQLILLFFFSSAMISELFICFFLYRNDKIERMRNAIQEFDRNYNFLNGAAFYVNLAITMHFEQSN